MQKQYSIHSLPIFRSVALAALVHFSIFIPAGVLLSMATSEKSRKFLFSHYRSWDAFFNIFLILLGILAALLAFLFVVCLAMKVYRITLYDGWIRGRNYYGFRREFRMDEITSVEPHSQNGMTGWILRTEARGSILVPTHVERVEELFVEIEKALQEKGLTLDEAEA